MLELNKTNKVRECKQPKDQTLLCIGRYIRYTSLLLGWNSVFCLQNCVKSSWHWFNKMLETFFSHVHMIVSHICFRFVFLQFNHIPKVVCWIEIWWLLKRSECSDLILTFKEGYKVCQENMAHTSTSPPSAAWPADKWKDGSVLSWHCCSPSDSRCKCCVCVYIYIFFCFDLIYFSEFGNQVINLLLMMWHHCFLFLPNIQGSRACLGLIPQSS